MGDREDEVSCNYSRRFVTQSSQNDNDEIYPGNYGRRTGQQRFELASVQNIVSSNNVVPEPPFSPLVSRRAVVVKTQEEAVVVKTQEEAVVVKTEPNVQEDDVDDGDKKPAAKIKKREDEEDESKKKKGMTVKLEHTLVDEVAKLHRTDAEDYEANQKQKAGRATASGVPHQSRVYRQLRLLPGGKENIRKFQGAKRDRRIAWAKKQAWKKYPEEEREEGERLFMQDLEDDDVLRREFYDEQRFVETVGVGKFTLFLEEEEEKKMVSDTEAAAAAARENQEQVQSDSELAMTLQKEEKLASNERLRRSFDYFDKNK